MDAILLAAGLALQLIIGAVMPAPHDNPPTPHEQPAPVNNGDHK